MPEIQLGAQTIRAYGPQVARIYMYDWLILMLLMVIEVILNIIEPFHRFVGEEMMTNLKYPLKDNTVPLWAVPIIAVVPPLVVIIIFYLIKKNVYDLHQAILGLLFSVLITGVLTDAIKDAVGRHRPDFFWRCFPDGKGNLGYGNIGSFAGLGFLSWYLSGKIRAFDHRGHVAKLCIVVLPLLVAALIGVSRVDDYWHHWEDVFAGGLIGWGPHAYFQMLAESRNVTQLSTNNLNGLSVHPPELENVNIEFQHGVATSQFASQNRDTGGILESTESGRRF
ncbi:hypothetical protein LguiA_000608 [Lonicera macranthoides]